MQGNIVLGCSGWNYPDTPDNGGWTEIFYPDKSTKRLLHYSQFFDTAEMDSTFYNRFYSKMTKGTFIGMARATPEKFQFSIKVPETITHDKRLNVDNGAITDKLGAVLIQLPPSFTVNEFRNIESFLERLLRLKSNNRHNYQYADIHHGRLKDLGKY